MDTFNLAKGEEFSALAADRIHKDVTRPEEEAGIASHSFHRRLNPFAKIYRVAISITMKGIDSGGVISVRLIALTVHQKEEEQILCFNTDTRTVTVTRVWRGAGKCLREVKPSRQTCLNLRIIC